MAIARELEGKAHPTSPLLRLRGQALLEVFDVTRLFRVVARQFELSHQVLHEASEVFLILTFQGVTGRAQPKRKDLRSPTRAAERPCSFGHGC